jgi:ABC-2 type transport system permease protein
VVGVLIRMKGRIMRHSFTGTKAATTVTGVVAGLAAAGCTLWLTAGAGTDRAGDALLLTMASWLLGWIVGPMMGGSDPGLRREHLRHVPLTDSQLAAGLLGAALVGVGPAVTLVAGTSLIWHALRLDPVAAPVALLVLPLFVLLLVALSNVVVASVGRVLNSRLSAALMAVPWGVLVCLGAQGWVLIAAITGGPASALPPSVADKLRLAPSGWPVVAVEAAARGDWALVGGVVAGLVAGIAAALGAWALLLRRPVAPTVIRGARWRGWRPATALAAVAGKELRTWGRDLVRIHFLAFALVYVLTYVLLPLLVNITDFLPMTGVFFAAFAVGCCAHLHSSDGTALWQTLLAPGAERADIRGRQRAWLLVVTPAAVALTVVGAVWHGAWEMVPWAIGLLPVVLGGGAGVLVLISVFVPVRIADPHKRGSNPGADGGNVSGIVWLALIALAVVASPALALLIAGTARDDDLLRWLATPVGLVLGAALAWGLGRVAIARLTRRGPELLARLA